MDPSVVNGAVESGALPQYMIFAVLVIWLITNFVLKWREKQEQANDPTVQVLRELAASLTGIQDMEKRQLDMLNALMSVLEAMKQQTHELHVAHLGDTARLPNGGLKWYNDPEVVRNLERTMLTLNQSIQSLNQSITDRYQRRRTGEHQT
jgi:hypothetical protein